VLISKQGEKGKSSPVYTLIWELPVNLTHIALQDHRNA